MFVKNQLTIDTLVYFWTLNLIPLVYIFILMLVQLCLDYCCFVESFEV